ncbi:response regulator [Pantoea dispersa]|uniref:response regulator n=1 Tax=Pantoea dispersa TaxID=59814 RepID=UPI0039B54716
MNISNDFSPLHIVTVDDHEVILHGLNSIIKNEKDFKLVGSFRSGRVFLNSLDKLIVDVAIIDYFLHPDDVDGEALLNMLLTQYPDITVVVFSAIYESGTVELALRAGAKAFIGKNSQLEELITAVRRAACGEIYLEPDMALQLVQRHNKHPLLKNRSKAKANMLQAGQKLSVLTQKEIEVVSHYLQGMTVSQIAEKFCRSVKTISGQKQSSLRKLGLKNDHELYKLFNLHD